MTMRRYRSRGHLALPMSVLPAAGGENMRLQPGDVFEIAAEKVDRFIRLRLSAGDLEDVTDAPVAPTAAKPRKE